MLTEKLLQSFFDELEICDNPAHFKTLAAKLCEMLKQTPPEANRNELKSFFYNTIFRKILHELIFQEKKSKGLLSNEEFVDYLKDVCSLEDNWLSDHALCFDVWYSILEEIQGRKIVSDSQVKNPSRKVQALSLLIHINLFGDTQKTKKLLQSIFVMSNAIFLHSYLQKLISYIVILINVCEGSLAESVSEYEYYKTLCQSIFEHGNDQLMKEVSNRYIILGKGEMLVEPIYQEPNFKNSNYFKFMQEELLTLNHSYKIIKILLKMSAKRDANISVFVEVLKNFNLRTVVGMILDKVIFGDNISPRAAKTLIAYFKEMGIDKGLIKQITLQILRNWGNTEFLRFGSKQQQKFLSNLLKLCLEFFQVEDLNDEELLGNLQTGIQIRFEYQTSFEFVKKSGHMIWKCLRSILKVENNEDDGTKDEYDDFDKFPEFLEDSEEEEAKNSEKIEAAPQSSSKTEPANQPDPGQAKKSKLIEEFIDEEDEEKEFLDVNLEYQNDNPLIFTAPKHLYDCLLGLQQEADRTRFEQSLKYLNYLIRKNLDDLDLVCEELAGVLLRIHEGLFHIELFSVLRKRALIALVIMKPAKVSRVLIQRFYSSECSMGDRLMLVDILKDAAQELSDHPEKYSAEKFNEYEEETQEFTFKKVTSRLYSEEEKRKNKISAEKKEKTEKNSHRWGETKRAFLEISKADGEAQKLKKLEKGELIIIKKEHKKDFFLNRFNELCLSFFYPLVVPMRVEKSKYMNETAILGSMMLLVATYLECAKNAHFFYDICLEGLDFVMSFIHITELNLTRAMLQSLYKISIFVNKNVIMSYPLLVDKLIETAKTLANMKQKETQDTAAKYIISEIINNINKLFAISSGI